MPTSLCPTGLNWISAGRCLATNHCVEVARMGERVAVRDSKDPSVVLLLTRLEFEAFLDGAKQGEFDHFVTADVA